MDASRTDNLARSVTYQICRRKADVDAIEIVLSLFVRRETVSVTTIARLAASDAAQVLERCMSHLEGLGIRPVEDAIAYDRAA